MVFEFKSALSPLSFAYHIFSFIETVRVIREFKNTKFISSTLFISGFLCFRLHIARGCSLFIDAIYNVRDGCYLFTFVKMLFIERINVIL